VFLDANNIILEDAVLQQIRHYAQTTLLQ